MNISNTGIELIKHFEDCKLKPYLCSAGFPTIGWGNTMYKNGRRVKLTDRPITQTEADDLFMFWVNQFDEDVDSLVTAPVIAQHQFDALVSFAYNVGSDIDQDSIPEGLGDSRLLKLVNNNPNDPNIINEFLKWNKSKGKVSNGLVRRRTVEAYYYSTGKLDLKRKQL